jgi:hypothetical protein
MSPVYIKIRSRQHDLHQDTESNLQDQSNRSQDQDHGLDLDLICPVVNRAALFLPKPNSDAHVTRNRKLFDLTVIRASSRQLIFA